MFCKNRKNIASLKDFGELITPHTDSRLRSAFQDICIKLSRVDLDTDCKKFAVTSTTYCEGKTYVAVNTAIVLAETFIDKKILLVNLDFDKNSEDDIIANLVSGNDSSADLSNYLSSQTDEVHHFATSIPNLFVINSGTAIASPIGMINSNRMQDLLADIEDEYSYVIFNLAPVKGNSYSTALSDKADGYIIVAREGVTSINDISDVEDAILASGGPVLGIILTGHIIK